MGKLSAPSPHLLDSGIIAGPEEQRDVWQLLEVISFHQLKATLAPMRLEHSLEPATRRAWE
jgi:hypothetical protein